MLKITKKLIKPIKIRWFSLYNAMKRIKEVFLAILLALRELKNENTCIVAEALFEKLHKIDFIIKLFFF